MKVVQILIKSTACK